MGRLKSNLLLILSLVILPVSLFPQTQPVQVKNVNFYFEPSENELVITYDLVNSSPLELYEIELTFIDGMNRIIRPESVFGDVGKDIKGGEDKRITWNIFNDVESLSETARPAIQIISINNKPLDPDLALIMNQISMKEDPGYHFIIHRDGLLIGGLGCGVAAVLCNLKADGFIEEQNQAENLEEYELAGDNAQKYYTISYVLGGISTIAVGYSVYQYIRGGKSKNRKTAFRIDPGINHGFYLSVTRSF